MSIDQGFFLGIIYLLGVWVMDGDGIDRLLLGLGFLRSVVTHSIGKALFWGVQPGGLRGCNNCLKGVPNLSLPPSDNLARGGPKLKRPPSGFSKPTSPRGLGYLVKYPDHLYEVG